MKRWSMVTAVVLCAACSNSTDTSHPNPPGAAGAPQAPSTGGGSPIVGSTAPPAGGAGGPITSAGGGNGAAGSSTAAAGSSAPTTGGSGGDDATNPPDPAAPAVHGWAMMGFDSRNNYWNPNETTISTANAGMLEELWVFEVSGYPPGSPVVADGKVFVLATGGMYAIDLETGKQVWANLDIKGQSSLAYDGEFLYAHMTPGAQLYKVKAADGSVVWGPIKTYGDVAGSDGTSSPILAAGKVMVGHSTLNEIVPASPDDQTNARGGVFAADVETGQMAWHYYTVELPENGAMVWSTVSVDLASGVVFAGTGNNYTVKGDHSDAIHAIDLAAGTKLWSKQVRADDMWTLGGAATGEDTDFGANPILADANGMKLVADGDKGSAFWALDRTTGDVLWSRKDLSTSHNAANGGVLNNGAFDGEAFYVISNQPNNASILHKLDAKDGTDVWPAKSFPTVTWGAPSGANGVLYVPVNSDLVLLDAATGDELKRFDTGGTIVAGSAAIVDGKVVVKSGMQYPLDFTGSVKNNNQIHCYGFKK